MSKTIIGIRNGMVMQRGKDNFCDILLHSDTPIGEVTVTGGPYPGTPTVTPAGDGYRLRGIRVGGPYTVCVDGEVFREIYVGDVWILAGQSNMQGIGRMVEIERNDNPAIRALYMEDEWRIANHPLHEMWFSIYKVHTDYPGTDIRIHTVRGVGPGLSFAERMYELTHLPQGLICCAHGGTNLFHNWDPARKGEGTDKSFYAATFDRIRNNGSNVRGIFWYQGCSDAGKDTYLGYTDRMVELVRSMRADLGFDAPFVQVQIANNCWVNPADRDPNMRWMSIREQQRLLSSRVDRLDTVSTVSLHMADWIHLDAPSQKVLGRDAAEAMYCLCFGEHYGVLPAIRLGRVRLIPDELDPERMSDIILTFENVHGALRDFGRATGFGVSSDNIAPKNVGLCHAFCDGNRVIIRTAFSKEKLKHLYFWHGGDANAVCNVVDGMGRSIPAFGPILLGDAAEE